jgi:excisionase family DNA binding protein
VIKAKPIAKPAERDPLWLDFNEAMSVAGIRKTTLYKLIEEGRVRSTKVGHKRLVWTQSLVDL